MTVTVMSRIFFIIRVCIRTWKNRKVLIALYYCHNSVPLIYIYFSPNVGLVNVYLKDWYFVSWRLFRKKIDYIYIIKKWYRQTNQLKFIVFLLSNSDEIVLIDLSLLEPLNKSISKNYNYSKHIVVICIIVVHSLHYSPVLHFI